MKRFLLWSGYTIFCSLLFCLSCGPEIPSTNPTIVNPLPLTTNVSTSHIPLSTDDGTKAGNKARNGLLWGAAGLGILAVACLIIGLWLQIRAFFISAAGCMASSILLVGLAVYLEWLLLGILAIIICSFIIVGVVLFRTAKNVISAIEKSKETGTDGIPIVKFDNPNLDAMGSLAKGFVNLVQKKKK
jgi:hypothetical protein